MCDCVFIASYNYRVKVYHHHVFLLQTFMTIFFVFVFLLLQDFCYAADPDTFNVMDVINMCVTVIAYAPDSFRSTQMLVGGNLALTHLYSPPHINRTHSWSR